MSNFTTELTIQLNSAAFWIASIMPPLQIIFGTIGNALNLMVFSRRSLRTNPCSLHFFAGSINSLFLIYMLILPPYLTRDWNLDSSSTNTVYCKLRYYLGYVSYSLLLWFTVLASIDRYLSSSRNVRHRRLSKLRNARKMIIFTTTFTFLIYLHVLILITTLPYGNVSVCSSIYPNYIIFLSLFYLLVSTFLAIILMSIFGMLTVINVQKTRRIAPQENNARNQRLRSHNRQLIKMLLVQVLLITLLTIPFATLSAWSTFALAIFHYKLSTFEQALYSFAYQFFRSLSTTNPILGFYIYSLTGCRFRVEMKHCIASVLTYILRSTDLIRYLPFRVQQVRRTETQMDANTNTALRNRRENMIRQQRTMHLTPTV